MPAYIRARGFRWKWVTYPLLIYGKTLQRLPWALARMLIGMLRTSATLIYKHWNVSVNFPPIPFLGKRRIYE